jgi:hypothetical protein
VDIGDFIAEETRNVFRDMLDNLEPHICETSKPVSVVSPVVEYSRHQIYKSILVSQLNGNPYLRAANYANTQLFGLGSDCAVFFVQRTSTTQISAVKAVGKLKRNQAGKSGRATSVQNGGDKGTWWLGRVQKMRQK